MFVDFLKDLGCIGDSKCPLNDFTINTPCDYKDAFRDFALECTDDGFVKKL
jgi:hypothetical protein